MDRRQRPDLHAGPTVRSYPAQFEVRSKAGSTIELQGYASVYDQGYEMFDMFGSYTEVARSGMCAKTLQDGADVAYLANHEGLSMARTKAGTLQLSEDSTGLLSVAQVNTTRSDVRDLVTAIEDGAVDQMSFAFRVIRQQWSPDYDQRDLTEVNLDRGDVSAVNFGANPMTSVGAARAFRSARAAELQRMATELVEGRSTPRAMGLAARALDLLASYAEGRPEEQSLFPEQLRQVADNADDARAVEGAMAVLRLREAHQAERRAS